MSFKKQVKKLKDNWLLFLGPILIVVILLGLFMGIGSNYSLENNIGARNYLKGQSMELLDGGYRPSYNNDFAPEVEDRKILKSSNLYLEIKKGAFFETDATLKNIIKSNDVLVLNENIYTNNYNLKNINYTLKVKSDKLTSFVSQLKGLGKIVSYSEGLQDITGSYTNLESEIAVERLKLDRYYEIYDSNKLNYDNKVKLIDKIFYQERKIKYLEESLINKDNQIAYSTVQLSISEKSNYVNIAFVKFSNLVKTLVGSINVLLYVLFAIVPFILLFWIISLIISYKKHIKKRRK